MLVEQHVLGLVPCFVLLLAAARSSSARVGAWAEPPGGVVVVSSYPVTYACFCRFTAGEGEMQVGVSVRACIGLI